MEKCLDCGNVNPPGALYCAVCGSDLLEKVVQPEEAYGRGGEFTDDADSPIHDWLTANVLLAVFSLFCFSFLPVALGTVGAVFGWRVNGLDAKGRVKEARRAAEVAKVLFWVGLAMLAIAFFFGRRR